MIQPFCKLGQMPKKGSLKKSRATKRRTFELGVFPLPTLQSFRWQTLWRTVTTNVAGRPVAFHKMGCSGKSPKDTILAATSAPQIDIHLNLSADIHTQSSGIMSLSILNKYVIYTLLSINVISGETSPPKMFNSKNLRGNLLTTLIDQGEGSQQP